MPYWAMNTPRPLLRSACVAKKYEVHERVRDMKFSRGAERDSVACGALCAAALLLAPGAAAAAQRTPQLAEDNVQERRLPVRAGPLADAPATRVCQTGARWMRLKFSELSLRSYDA